MRSRLQTARKTFLNAQFTNKSSVYCVNKLNYSPQFKISWIAVEFRFLWIQWLRQNSPLPRILEAIYDRKFEEKFKQVFCSIIQTFFWSPRPNLLLEHMSEPFTTHILYHAQHHGWNKSYWAIIEKKCLQLCNSKQISLSFVVPNRPPKTKSCLRLGREKDE